MKQIHVHERRSIRLKDYDYSSPGEYFVTICTHQRECLFGEILQGEMILNSIGLIVQKEWLKIPHIRPELELDDFILMPNHLHGIIFIKEEPKSQMVNLVGTHSCASLQRQPRSLGAIIAGFKSSATKRINEERNMPGVPVWQSRYYDRIVRDEKELNNIREYIINNPLKWQADEEHPLTKDQKQTRISAAVPR